MQQAYRSIFILLFLFSLTVPALSQDLPDSTSPGGVQLPPEPPPPVFEPEFSRLNDSILSRSIYNPFRTNDLTGPFKEALVEEVSSHSFLFPSQEKGGVSPHEKVFRGKETMFYAMLSLLLLFALLKVAFPKYLSDTFRLFFRRTLKQRQISEQLLQSPLPSLMLNIFFMITGGLYLSFLLNIFNEAPIGNFWLLAFYCAAGLALVYLVKFIGLKITGWIFSISAATDSYIFIVFMINKIIGIFLLPFTIILGLMNGRMVEPLAIVSLWGVGALFLYRFVLSYRMLHNQIKINPFHFFLYLCAFEIAPLLLIYKMLIPIF